MSNNLLTCPRCGGSEFRENANGTKTCLFCDHVLRVDATYARPAGAPSNEPAEVTPEPLSSSTRYFRCPMCGSENPEEGNGRCTCAFCGNHYVAEAAKPEPAPLPEPPKESAPAPKEEAKPITPQKPDKTEKEDKERLLNGKEVFDLAKTNTVEVHSRFSTCASCGSGFFFAQRYILTNAHVVIDDPEDPRPQETIIAVNYKGGRRVDAKIVAFDLANDMAILETSMICTNLAKIAPKMPDTGEDIFAVGNSAGEGMCILQGIVADQLRDVQGLPYMMISANIVGGNSGGPIFNRKGEVVGIVTLHSVNSVAMNYGIPITRIEKFLTSAEKKLKKRFERR